MKIELTRTADIDPDEWNALLSASAASPLFIPFIGRRSTIASMLAFGA